MESTGQCAFPPPLGTIFVDRNSKWRLNDGISFHGRLCCPVGCRRIISCLRLAKPPPKCGKNCGKRQDSAKNCRKLHTLGAHSKTSPLEDAGRKLLHIVEEWEEGGRAVGTAVKKKGGHIGTHSAIRSKPVCP